jgi:multidrug resistance efflux pump
MQDKLRATELSLDQAKRTLDIAKKNRDAGLSQASIGVENARIGLLQAQTNYGKLTVDAPIDGKITKVITSIGQTVNMGTPVIEIVSNTPEMTVDVEERIIS